MKKPNVRSVLLDCAKSINDNSVAVLLSGGIDSASVMFSMLEAGKSVTAYSFTLEGWASSDFTRAASLAKRFGVPFVPVLLPKSIDVLKADVKRLYAFGARLKTDFECGWPMLYAYKAAKEKHVASGMGADGHFCISKKGMIHFRNRIDEFRRALYANPAYAQKPIHERIAAWLSKTAIMPYMTQAMRNEFIGTTWDEVNRPKQKQPILDAFSSQFSQIKTQPHTNLQLGDSGIQKHFELLLKSDWNKHSAKSVTSIFNRMQSL